MTKCNTCSSRQAVVLGTSLFQKAKKLFPARNFVAG